MTPRQLYLYAITEATKVVDQVEPEQLGLPTPDTEWSVQELLQHIVYELAWTADIVAGKTIEEVDDKYEGDIYGKNPVEAWHHYFEPTRMAVDDCDENATAHLSYADKPVSDYLLEAGNDQLVHAWDLGQAIGVEVTFDEAVARELLHEAEARQKELAGSGLFAPPVKVPADADAQTQLLALLGRSKDWRKSQD